MPNSTITSKGQTTIPKQIRDHLKLQTGDEIDFIVTKDGSVTIQPVTLHVGRLRGILHRKGMKPLSVEAMNEAIRKRNKGQG